MSCKVTWCNKETEFYNKSQQYKYCSTHIQYKKYASNAPLRPWLMYKVEKLLEDRLNVLETRTNDFRQHDTSG